MTILRRSAAGLLLLIALLLIAGGLWLIGLGGSPYYLMAGLMVGASGRLLWRGRNLAALGCYGLMLLGTLVWAIWESGLDGWALVPRLLAPVLLGLILCLLFVPRPVRPYAWLFTIAALLTGAFTLHLAREQPSVAQPVASASDANSGDWLHYGANQEGQRFSGLAQINTANVAHLARAWTFRIGADAGGDSGSFETTPIAIGGLLYLCGTNNDVVALDGDTGAQIWRWRAANDMRGVAHHTCRGVAYHALSGASGPCAARIFTATTDARLVALDAASGKPCAEFGTNGVVDLNRGMGEVWKGYYYVTSAPAVVRGKLVLGGWVSDAQKLGEPSGVVRAFDARTGKLAWAWDIGRPGKTGEPGPGEEYSRGTPNSWAPISADEHLGLVYLPIGNATPDYFGMHRSRESETYSSSIVAVDAESGLERWHFQTTHHDLWDYDVASQPTLIDIPAGGGATIPALLAPTKRAELFLLDRRTGRPLAPVEERPVATDGAPEEKVHPTQPFSAGMPELAGPRLTESRMWGATPIDQLWCRILFRQSRYKGPLTPITRQWTLVYPGYLGGSDWGGVTVDPARGIAYVPVVHMPNRDRLLTRGEAKAMDLRAAKPGEVRYMAGALPQEGVPYAIDVKPFLSPIGIPCVQPPYGTLVAIDLRRRKIIWSRPIGTAESNGPLGLQSGLPLVMGTPMAGGAINTAGGLIFIAATLDNRIRAIDTRTGALLWNATLPAGGQATPMTFRSPRTGRQYVVIAAGGNPGLLTRRGDYVVAYALPRVRRN